MLLRVVFRERHSVRVREIASLYMKLRYVIYGLLLIGLFLFAIWEQMTPTAGQKGFLRIVRNLTPLKKIIIQPYPFSPAKWEIVVTNVADLAQVHKALQHLTLSQ